MDRTHLGQGELNAPDLALVAESVLAGELMKVVMISIIVALIKSSWRSQTRPTQGSKAGRTRSLSSLAPSHFHTRCESSPKIRCSSKSRNSLTHLELSVQTGRLVRPLGDLVGFGLLAWRCGHLYRERKRGLDSGKT